MPHTDRNLRVFLCHASQDKPVVRELYRRLLAQGWIDPWLDEDKLLPGQDWDMEIEKAVEAADAVIVCLSNNSVTKEGYVQRELKIVLDIALEKPEGTIFVVPLRLDDCPLPRRLRTWQYVDYFPAEHRNPALQRLLQSLTVRQNQLGTKEALDKKPEPLDTAAQVRLKEEKKSAELAVADSRTDALTSIPMGTLDLGASLLPIVYFILAGLFPLSFDNNMTEFVWGISAILAGIVILLKRQIASSLILKISLILFLVTHSVVTYSNSSGVDLSPVPSVLEGIFAWIVAGSWIAGFRSPRKSVPYSSILLAAFLFLVGTKLVINLFDKYPDGIPILIIISAILASVLLWFDQ